MDISLKTSDVEVSRRAVWPIIDGPLQGCSRAWPADFFYALERMPAQVTLNTGPPRCSDVPRKIEYRLRAVQQGGFVWTCAQPTMLA